MIFPIDTMHTMCFVKPTWQDMARPEQFALYFPIGPETQYRTGCTAMIAKTLQLKFFYGGGSGMSCMQDGTKTYAIFVYLRYVCR